MAGRERLTIELVVDDKGTVKLVQATGQIKQLEQSARQSGVAARQAGAEMQAGFGGGAEAAAAMSSALLRQIGIYGLLFAAVAKVGSAFIDAFSGGIEAADKFKVATVGIAASITDMSGKSGKAIAQEYAGNLAYAREMYEALAIESARHFATGAEMQQAFNILVQKGVVLRREDIGALGTVVDKIMMMTQGQMASLQIAQELRAIIDGQARATSQLAMLLKDQLGKGWEDLIKQHREAGDLIQWMAGLFPGLQAAVEDIQYTLQAQRATLETQLAYIGREGLYGAYLDIAGVLRQINEYLIANKGEIADTLSRTYNTLSRIVGVLKAIGNAVEWWTTAGHGADAVMRDIYGAVQLLGDMVERASKFFEELIGKAKDLWNIVQRFVDLAKDGINIPVNLVLSIFGGANLSDLGKILKDQLGEVMEAQTQRERYYWGLMDTYGKEFTDQMGKRYENLGDKLFQTQMKVIKTPMPMPQIISKLPGVAPAKTGFAALGQFEGWEPAKGRPPLPGEPGGKGGGGKSAEAAARRVQNILMTLDQEIARLQGDRLAEMEAWATKMITEWERLGAGAEDTELFMSKIAEVQALKRQKMHDEFIKWYVGANGDKAQQILLQEEDLNKRLVQTEDERLKVAEWRNRELAKIELDRAEEMVQAQQRLTGALTEATPSLREQHDLQRRMLEYQHQLAEFAIQRKLLAHDISEEEARVLQLMEGQVYAAQQVAQARSQWETKGFMGGLQHWGEEMGKIWETTEAKGAYSLMEELRTGIANALAGGIKAAMRGEKADIEEMLLGVADKFIDFIMEWVVNQFFAGIAQAMGMAGKSMTGDATTAAVALEQGGMLAGQHIINAANYWASVSGGGGGGGGGGLLGGLLGGLFGGGGFGGEGLGTEYHGTAAAILKMQHGGVVTSPTVGLFGEAGAEAFLPVKKLPSGDYGVQARLGVADQARGAEGPPNITIINNTGTPFEATANMTGRDIEIQLDRQIASLIRKGGETRRAITQATTARIRPIQR